MRHFLSNSNLLKRYLSLTGGICSIVEIRLLEISLRVFIHIHPVLQLGADFKSLCIASAIDCILASRNPLHWVFHRQVGVRLILSLNLTEIASSNFLQLFWLLSVVVTDRFLASTLAILHQLKVVKMLLRVHTDHLIRYFC